jgi:hypothetical protein
MSEFKGTTDEWYSVFTTDNKRAVRSSGGLICILTKPSRYPGQDERYERELEENKADQKLISASLNMLKALEKIVEMNRQHAEDEYGDPEKAESWSCVKVAREAIKKAL